MARPRKSGDVESPQVSLRGRLLEAIRIVAERDGKSLPEAVRMLLEVWINSPEGKQYLLENYRFDVTDAKLPSGSGATGREDSNVLSMKTPRGSSSGT